MDEQGTIKLSQTKSKSFFIGILIVLLIFFITLSGGLLFERFFITEESFEYIQTRSEVINLIKRDGLQELPSQEEIEDGQLRGLVSSLNDPFSSYLNKEESADFQNSLNQRYEGIGLRFDDFNGEIFVDKVFRQSPAESAGVQERDVLVSVDDEEIIGQEISEVAEKIRGEEGTQVKLRFLRDNKEIQVIITRNRIESDLVFLEIIEDIALIEITSFGDTVDQRIDEIVQEINSNPKINRIILDLRGNSGGLLDQSIQVISYFTEPNEVAVIEKTKDQEIVLRTKNKEPNLRNFEVIVVVDEDSASASEIVAGALRDLNGSILVGQKTFGKGVVQRIYELNNQDQLKLTIAEWLTPNGTAINEQGLNPDIFVPSSEDSIEKAIEELKKEN